MVEAVVIAMAFDFYALHETLTRPMRPRRSQPLDRNGSTCLSSHQLGTYVPSPQLSAVLRGNRGVEFRSEMVIWIWPMQHVVSPKSRWTTIVQSHRYGTQSRGADAISMAGSYVYCPFRTRRLVYQLYCPSIDGLDCGYIVYHIRPTELPHYFSQYYLGLSRE